MDSNQWTQEEIGGLKLPMGSEIAAPSGSTCSRQQPMVEIRKVRPQKEQALNCPRCHSTNTKFCYYNNYSLTQPRYFCKTCRRYWTEGGTLRNVPVGGGSRKNKRSTSAAPHKLLPDLNPPPNISHHHHHHHHHQFPSRNPNKILHEGQDLNLGFPAGSSQDHCYQANSQFFELPKMDDTQLMIKSSSSSTPTTPFAALELLRTGLIGSRGMNSFITSSTTASPAPDLNAIYTSGFSFQDLKPAAAIGFSSVDGVLPLLHPKAGIDQENGGRLMFPFGAMKQVRASSTSTTSEVDHQNKGQPNSNGFWNGMLGGGSW